jgi:hypothetical protein
VEVSKERREEINCGFKGFKRAADAATTMGWKKAVVIMREGNDK